MTQSWRIIRRYWPKKVHAFGISTQWILEKFPFFSCDSTTAVMGGGLGRVLDFRNGRMKISSWQRQGKAFKFSTLVDNNLMDGSQHLERRIHNMRQMLKFEAYLTDLWKRKGIDFA